ncbi:hypothetical protein FB451DRAFT_1233259 [Mycena latifolia]|nr:hypothetical protein FB451DRAFT_1233259 [Mycena latifolia]
MGQRHQVFIVARVAAHNTTTPRYRCVGAYHHQWFVLPLMATRRFLTLIKQKDNAEIIEEEIRAIQGKYGLGREKPSLPTAPCPYALFLLASAWCVDLEDHYASGVSFEQGMLDAKMGSTQGDNNDGITVIDITEPTNPSYCFVSIWGLEASGGVKRRVPLSAEEYVRAYYPVPSEKQKEKKGVKETEEDVQNKIDSLRDQRIMTLDVLAETWPKEYKVWFGGKADAITSILRRQNPFPDSGLSLLVKVLQHDAGSDKSTLDLSDFPLSDHQIISLLTLSEMKDIEVLKLSHNPNITVDGLRQVFSIASKLRRLVLLDTPISDEQICELLTNDSNLFRNLEELVHPALLSWQNPVCYPSGFGYVGLHDRQRVASASLAVFTPATLVQCLTDYLSPMMDSDVHVMYSHFSSSLVPQAALASAIRREGEPWGERRVHCLPSLPDNPFGAEGWLFAEMWDWMCTGRESLWICDFKAFLNEMALEGRPAPSEEAVKKLEIIFAELESKKNAKLFTLEDFLPFTQKFMMTLTMGRMMAEFMGQ